MFWIFGIYVLIWIVAEGWMIPRPVILVTLIPLTLAFVSVASDELAESGQQFRPDLATPKFCSAAQWALMVFYFSVSRGTLLPTSSNDARDLAWIYGWMSLATEIVTTLAIRRSRGLALSLVAFELALLF